MSYFKLIVLMICYINRFCWSQSNYCEICVNHTLCKYKTVGPSPSCEYYDSSALLTRQDITKLVNRINQRRNFVAMGYSKKLPQAANMKKIHWSTELATFAQRWVDQCDPYAHPDKEDQCRDLGNLKVGQSIATIIGPSPGLNVKSFIEMWFIKLLDYTGSVTYYNESRDFKTNSFTQLIWADTEFVGCGKAKFYVDERDSIFERLVCNFAPKGNNHGKPVYSIGYPGTQCKSKMMPAREFRELCDYEDQTIATTKIATWKHPANSLLKILNLSSNDTLKHEIDPISNNLKHNVRSNFNNGMRNQKTRHIFPNKTYGNTFSGSAAARITPFRDKNIWRNISSKSDDDYLYHPYQQERGHSHLYHGHETTRYNYEITTQMNTFQDYRRYETNTYQEFRRYDFATIPMNTYTSSDIDIINQNTQCTRQIRPDCCTRMPNNCCEHTTACPYETSWRTPAIEYCCGYPPKQTCPPISTYNDDTNCQCTAPCCTTKSSSFSILCPGIHRKNNEFNGVKNIDVFQDYDMVPNIAVRSGNNKITLENSSKKEILAFSEVADIDTPYIDATELGHSHDGLPDYSKYKSHNHDYLYHSVDSRVRKKRVIADKTSNPFWQNEDFLDKSKTYQLRSIRYTTLANKINKKSTKNSDLAKWPTQTEPITFAIKNNMADYTEEHFTEKYLSFDELMHLRKINDGYIEHDFRRKAGGKTTTKKKKDEKKTTKKESATTKKSSATTTKKSATTASTKATTTTKKTTTATTEYTANTPFERKKHCTRKLTCTWTAFTADKNGDIKLVDQMLERGSRTPPGYVEGCTRTSTCTREYMDRNKVSTIADGGDGSSKEPTPGDEDYCERRSLNVQRRNSDEKKTSIRFFSHAAYTDSPTTPVQNIDFQLDTSETLSETHDCVCNQKYVRKKRQLKGTQLNKIFSLNEPNKIYNKQCPCNCSFALKASQIMLVVAFLIY